MIGSPLQYEHASNVTGNPKIGNLQNDPGPSGQENSHGGQSYRSINAYSYLSRNPHASPQAPPNQLFPVNQPEGVALYSGTSHQQNYNCEQPHCNCACFHSAGIAQHKHQTSYANQNHNPTHQLSGTLRYVNEMLSPRQHPQTITKFPRIEQQGKKKDPPHRKAHNFRGYCDCSPWPVEHHSFFSCLPKTIWLGSDCFWDPFNFFFLVAGLSVLLHVYCLNNCF